MSEFQRLPTNVLPVNYELTVKPDFNTYKFDGNVVINVQVKSEVNKIVLNSSDISFESAEYDQNGVLFESSNIEVIPDQELVYIHFNESILIGNGKLIIKYSGILNDNMKGFYRVKYKHGLSKQPYCVTTQFETCDARKALPCFDEPAFKATFDVIIIADADKTILSNMPLKEIKNYENDNKLRKFIFERTPIMSTYLLAFVVGEFGSIKGKLHNGASITVYTPLEKEHMGEFALDISIKTVKFYSEYFGIEYPLPKLDLIAVPENPIEAMENWGLIICNEANMLLDKNDFSFQTKITVAFIITHEIAHQWFGNIVTMDWWSDLWLNEGFATWAAYIATEYCLPEYDIWTNFNYSRANDAFELDSLVNTHPIEVPINAPSEIDEIFDSISYDKGACVLRMLREHIGDDAFRSGIHNYLEAFKYSNARTDQLWSFISESSNQKINEFMQTWTQLGGFPCVLVETKRNKDNELILVLNQKRFFANGNNSINDKTIWKIPITISIKSTYPNTKCKFIFDTASVEYNLGKIDASEWIIINNESLNYHRTYYQPDLLESLMMNIENLTHSDRLMLQNNTFAFTQAGFLSTLQLLKMFQAYQNEENPYVWNNLIENLLKLSSLLVYTDYFNEYKRFVIRLCKPFSTKIGWKVNKDEDIMFSMCKETIHLIMVLMGDEESLKVANELFDEHKKGNLIPAFLKKPVYTAVLLSNNDDILNGFFELYEKCELPEESLIILEALSYVHKPENIDKILKFAFDKVTFEDYVIFMGLLSKNPCSKYSTQLTWNYIKENYSKILDRYDKNILLGRLIKPIIEKFSRIDLAEDVKEFFKTHEAIGAEKAIDQGLEKIYIRSMWLSRICSELFSSKFKF